MVSLKLIHWIMINVQWMLPYRMFEQLGSGPLCLLYEPVSKLKSWLYTPGPSCWKVD